MKIKAIALFIALFITTFSSNGATSKSFFMPRSINQDAVLQYAGSQHFIDAHKKDNHNNRRSFFNKENKQVSKNKKYSLSSSPSFINTNNASTLLASNNNTGVAPASGYWSGFTNTLTRIKNYFYPQKQEKLHNKHKLSSKKYTHDGNSDISNTDEHERVLEVPDITPTHSPDFDISPENPDLTIEETPEISPVNPNLIIEEEEQETPLAQVAQSGGSFSLNAATPVNYYNAPQGAHSKHDDNKTKSTWFTLSGTVFYEESTNKSDLARYFFPNNKTQLVIKGATAPGARDISATWLQIAGLNPTETVAGFATPEDSELYLNAFQSTISISPEMKSFGTIIKLNKTFDCMSDRLWMSATLPFMEVQTNLKLSEFAIQNEAQNLETIAPFIIKDPGAGNPVTRLEQSTDAFPLNATEGFDNPLWHYGKLKNGKQKVAGLADIKIVLGGTPVLNNNVLVDVYATWIIPTSNKPKVEYLFEPLLGNAKHMSVGCGVSGDFDLKHFDKDNGIISISSILEYNYSLKNTEKRSFDLISNGQWSRYLLVFQPNNGPNPTPKPGINFFTQDCNVTPQSEINWLASFHCRHKFFFLETGYNLWWHDREKVTLKEEWSEQVALAYIAFESDLGLGITPFNIQSFSNATISSDVNQAGQGDGDVINFVQQDNLNLGSATHPSQLTHKFYLATGFNGTWKKNIFSVMTGASYEFASKNTALEQWGIWAQLNITI